ncbi:hypothetical protein BCR32DRAFT_301258 [Anaeromyces robustus]|uniref:N-acetylmuramoyl-L-alanine amidase domain-containing protein n=1 Tax=Anaeromyces robustus TaxID=1754192 RepID=A0A1Y1XM76_9FUNG|nr:hypothetical protein BCR32DRAFT_301258 [Anaeromyces robustus]|eukprot:ORX86616.1 hypothetical protein BCR32DRAFT_301258 [Anaeromyces robustus]
MEFINYLLIVLILIESVVASGHNHLAEQLALVTLAAGNNKGQIARDENNEFIKIRIDSDLDIKADITQIIPELRDCNKSSGECDKKFNKIYKLAKTIVNDKKSIIEQRDINGNLISKSYDAFNPYIPLFDSSPSDSTENDRIKGKLSEYNFKVYPNFKYQVATKQRKVRDQNGNEHTINVPVYKNIDKVTSALLDKAKKYYKNNSRKDDYSNTISSINDLDSLFNDLLPNNRNNILNLDDKDKEFIKEFKKDINDNNNEDAKKVGEIITKLTQNCLNNGCPDIDAINVTFNFVKIPANQDGNDPITYHVFTKSGGKNGITLSKNIPDINYADSININQFKGIQEVFRAEQNNNNLIQKSMYNHRFINSYKNIYYNNKGYNKENLNNGNRGQLGIDIIGSWGITLSKFGNTDQYPPDNNGYRVPISGTDPSNIVYNENEAQSKIIRTQICGHNELDLSDPNNINQENPIKNVICDYINPSLIKLSGDANEKNIPMSVKEQYLVNGTYKIPKFISFETMGEYFMRERIEKRVNNNNDNNYITNEEINDYSTLAVCRQIEELFAVDKDGLSESVINDSDHQGEYKKIDNANKNLYNLLSSHESEISVGDIGLLSKCEIPSLKKRAGGACTFRSPSVPKNDDIDSNISNVKNLLESGSGKSFIFKDSEIKDSFSKINDIMDKINKYKNNLSSDTKIDIINNLSNILTTYKDILHSQEVIENDSSKNIILSKELNHLTERLKLLYSDYIETYDKENQNSENNDENNNSDDINSDEINSEHSITPSIFLDTTNTNAESIFNEEKILKSLNKIDMVTKQSSNNFDFAAGAGIDENLNVNCDFDTLVNNIDNFDINNVEGLNTLLEEYNNINSIDENNKYDELHGKNTYNKKIIRKLKNALLKKLKEAVNAGKLETHNISRISNEKVDSNVEITQNDINDFKINSLSIIYKGSQIEFISTINYSTNFIKYFTNDMKKQIANLPKDSLPKDKYNSIKAFYNLVSEQGNKLMKYDSPENKDVEILHFTELLHNYNDLYAFSVTLNKYTMEGNNSNTIVNYYMSENLESRLNYHINNMMKENINNFINEYNKKYPNNKVFKNNKLIGNDSVTSESEKFKWGTKSTVEINVKSLSSILTNPKDSISSSFNEIISKTDGKNELHDVKRAYSYKNNLHKYKSPIATNSANSDEMVEMNDLLSFSDTKENIESYNEISYRVLTEYLSTMSEYDPNITIGNAKNNAKGELIISSIYKGATSVSDILTKTNNKINSLHGSKKLNDQDKVKINRAVENLTNGQLEIKLKIVKAIGKEHSDTINSAISDYESNVKSTRSLSNNGVTKSNDNLSSIRSTSNTKFSANLMKNINNKMKSNTNKLLKRINKLIPLLELPKYTFLFKNYFV